MALSAHLHDVFFHPGAHQTREYCEDHLRLDLHQVFGERIDAGAYFPRHGNRISGKKLDLIENQGWRLLFFRFYGRNSRSSILYLILGEALCEIGRTNKTKPHFYDRALIDAWFLTTFIICSSATIRSHHLRPESAQTTQHTFCSRPEINGDMITGSMVSTCLRN